MTIINALPRFGLSRFSPSMLTLWRGNPKLFCVRYLKKVRDDSDAPKAWRGRAVEAGMTMWLFKRDAEQAHAAAMAEWLNSSQGVVSEEFDEIRDMIPDMLDRAIEASAEWPVPTAKQVRVETWLPDVPAPVIGYADYVWPTHVRDLKSTTKIGGEVSDDHALQMALYLASDAMRNRIGELLYVTARKPPPVRLKKDGTPRKQPVRDPANDWKLVQIDAETAERALVDARATALSLLRFLDHARDADDALGMLPLNRDHYAWSPKLIEVAEAA